MSEEYESKLEEIEREIQEHRENINENEQRINNLEDREHRLEDYKIFLYPAEIKKYIQNLIVLQSKDDDDFHRYYPASPNAVEDYFNDLKFDSEKIKYNISIAPNDFEYLSRIISNQGWSGFYYLENIPRNIDLNKPIILYYGIIQMGAFFSNLHFNFTDQNNDVKGIKNLKSHGLDSSELKNISFRINVNDILSKKIKFEKTGLAVRFSLAYDSSLLKHFTNQDSLSLLDILKNYFWEKEPCIVKSQFQKDYGTNEPDVPMQSKLFNIYLLSYYLSILSRYKIQAWLKLLEDKQTNIRYYIEYFLKFAKDEFLTTIFDQLYEDRLKIPQIASMSSLMVL